MSSILSGDFEVKVDTAYLRNNGFTCLWPAEKLATRFVNGRPINDYHPHQKYWRWEDEDYNIDHFYNGYLYYFPDKFIGNTKSIIGTNENPRGYVYIYIDGLIDETTYKEKIYVQSAADIESAKTLLRKYADEENKNTWSYGWGSKYTKI